MLNGGLSPLRFDRKTGECKTAAAGDLRIQSNGITAANFVNKYSGSGDRTTAILRSLPPKVRTLFPFLFISPLG